MNKFKMLSFNLKSFYIAKSGNRVVTAVKTVVSVKPEPRDKERGENVGLKQRATFGYLFWKGEA